MQIAGCAFAPLSHCGKLYACATHMLSAMAMQSCSDNRVGLAAQVKAEESGQCQPEACASDVSFSHHYHHHHHHLQSLHASGSSDCEAEQQAPFADGSATVLLKGISNKAKGTSSQVMSTSKQVTGKSSQVMGTSSLVMEASSQVMSTSNQLMDTSSQVMETPSQVMGTSSRQSHGSHAAARLIRRCIPRWGKASQTDNDMPSRAHLAKFKAEQNSMHQQGFGGDNTQDHLQYGACEDLSGSAEAQSYGNQQC